MLTDVVSVRLVHVAASETELAQLSAVLDREEQRRAAALTEPLERNRYVTAHGAARLILGAILGQAPHELAWQQGSNGKPGLNGAQVSLSHSGDLSLIAVTPTRPVGVDIQEVISGLDVIGLAARFFLPEEAAAVASAADPPDAFAGLWARKEAVIKARGGRLMQGLRIPVQGRRSVVTGYPGAGGPFPHRVTEMPAPQGFRAAVALAGTEPYRVELTEWSLAEITAVDR